MQTAAQTALRARGEPDALFLATLKDTGNVTAACMVAGFDRSHIYQRKKVDTSFAAAWEAAIEVSVDKLELVARDRALQGVKEPVYYKGYVVGHVHKPSDRLMELLLKAHRPDKFNPVQKLEHSGGVSVAVVQFGAPGAVSPVIEHSASTQLPGVVPGSQIEGGASSDDPTPKLAAPENDEACHVAKFSDSNTD